jgi:two-component system, OmpR family, response regulator
MRKRTIVIVEDDPDQRRNYTDALRRRGFAVEAFAGRAEALRALATSPPDLAILDIMLGEEMDGGFDLCRELLARQPDLPVIFLTSRADDIDRISGLRLGAWDYQAKPVSLAFLAERVSSLFRILERRRGTQAESRVLQVGELAIDEEAMRATWRGEALAFTYTELNLLLEIVRRRAERGANYDELARATRQGVVENNTINTHVLHVRAKFRALDPGFDCIRSVYGYGYRWCCA